MLLQNLQRTHSLLTLHCQLTRRDFTDRADSLATEPVLSIAFQTKTRIAQRERERERTNEKRRRQSVTRSQERVDGGEIMKFCSLTGLSPLITTARPSECGQLLIMHGASPLRRALPIAGAKVTCAKFRRPLNYFLSGTNHPPRRDRSVGGLPLRSNLFADSGETPGR